MTTTARTDVPGPILVSETPDRTTGAAGTAVGTDATASKKLTLDSQNGLRALIETPSPPTWTRGGTTTATQTTVVKATAPPCSSAQESSSLHDAEEGSTLPALLQLGHWSYGTSQTQREAAQAGQESQFSVKALSDIETRRESGPSSSTDLGVDLDSVEGGDKTRHDPLPPPVEATSHELSPSQSPLKRKTSHADRRKPRTNDDIDDDDSGEDDSFGPSGFRALKRHVGWDRYEEAFQVRGSNGARTSVEITLDKPTQVDDSLGPADATSLEAAGPSSKAAGPRFEAAGPSSKAAEARSSTGATALEETTSELPLSEATAREPVELPSSDPQTSTLTMASEPSVPSTRTPLADTLTPASTSTPTPTPLPQRTAAAPRSFAASSSALPSLGARVFAKWKDGSFYPAIVTAKAVPGRSWQVQFSDGSQVTCRRPDLRKFAVRKDDRFRYLSDDGQFDVNVLELGENNNIVYCRRSSESAALQRTGSEEVLKVGVEALALTRHQLRHWEDRKFASKLVKSRHHLVANAEEPASASLFAGYAFIITGSRRLDEEGPLCEASSQPDDPLMTSPRRKSHKTPQHGAFDRAGLEQQIKANGGIVWKEFEDELSWEGGNLSRKSSSTVHHLVVLAEKPMRTAKYLKALILACPIISPLWVRDCISQHGLVDWQKYLLAAGHSKYLDAHRSQDPSVTPDLEHILARWADGRILPDSRISFLGPKKLHGHYASLLRCMGAQSVHCLSRRSTREPRPLLSHTDVDLVVHDSKDVATLPLASPTVSTEWVKECIIMSTRLPMETM